MADIELVIKIPEEQYNTIKSDLYNTFPAEMKEWGLEAIKNGTPLDDLKAEIDRQEKWLSQAGYTPYNTDIAFDSIKTVLKGANE